MDIDVLVSSISIRFPVFTGKLSHSATRPFSKKTHFIGLFFEETGENEQNEKEICIWLTLKETTWRG